MTPLGRFRFPLATLLRVESLREEAARLELAQALARVAQSRQALADTQSRLAECLAGLNQRGAEGWPPGGFLLQLRYAEFLGTALGAWRQRLAQEETEAARRREVLVRHHRERRFLEIMESKARARFRRELARRLEREAEALTLSRWPAAGGPEPG